MTNTDALLKNGRCLLLAYDQGFEHGPTDFDSENVDPDFVLNIAKESGVYTGVILHAGIAEKYSVGDMKLVVKLNGKTKFHQGEEPLSLQIESVDSAIKLGAVGVGYTIYVGSEHEEKMLAEFRKICEEAHSKGLTTIVWMYPRGKHVEGKENTQETLAYAARLGLELGADMVKIPYTGDLTSFSWVVKSAGKAKILVQGGSKINEDELLTEIRTIMASGATGMAIGRNIWQSKNPIELSKKVAQIIWNTM